MKQFLTSTLLLIILSCGPNNKSNRSELLTSSSWTIEKGSVLGDFTEKYTFLTDGTVLLVTGGTDVYGQWSWTKDDEIYVKPEGRIQNGQKIKAERGYGFYIRIVELNDKMFRTLERYEADNWGSGLIKEREYSALSL
jgi:hypothetical protein